MKFYLDIKLPLGFQIKSEYRKHFSGLIKSLLNAFLADLEENSDQHVSHFKRERLSKAEKNALIRLLRESLEERELSLSISKEQEISSYSTEIISKTIGRYTR